MRAHEPRPSRTRRHHHPKGDDHFYLRSKFLSYSRAGLAGEAADEQLFARRNFPCPAVGLSYAHSQCDGEYR